MNTLALLYLMTTIGVAVGFYGRDWLRIFAGMRWPLAVLLFAATVGLVLLWPLSLISLWLLGAYRTRR